MVRKYSEPLEEHGNFLIPVPGGNDGPSGVLVCSENYITYKNFGDQADIRMPIPRRKVCILFISPKFLYLLKNVIMWMPNIKFTVEGQKILLQ